MSKLNDIFHPEKELINKRLSGNSPCEDCENMHRFTHGTSWMEEPIDPNECSACLKIIKYQADCMVKLAWYEKNDCKVNGLERKDKDRYDCGIKCPQTSNNDGYPILYPNGWAKGRCAWQKRK